MNTPVTLPLWLLVLIFLFAAVTFASHFLFPSVRWFFRKRMERAVAKLNKRLTKPIEPFKLAARYDTIQRVIYDPVVGQAVYRAAQVEKIPENVAFERARRYAREIVPSFSASVYFGFGARVARWLSKSIYHIRLGAFDADSLVGIDKSATVVFVINHRSNMDYVLVTHLISRASTVAYAVGEWARVWPLSWLVRAMGAYFIRRGSKGQLYRAVLARYVQMATAAGVTQAFFPEGGLSLDGKLARPRLGLISYMVEAWRPDGRDIIFVPVGLNYDRVLEDRVLERALVTGDRRFKPPLSRAIKATLYYLWRIVTLRFTPFGTASVGFGEPVKLSSFMRESDDRSIDHLGELLMDRIAAVVPLVPVPLVCRAVLNGADTTESILNAIVADLEDAKSRGVSLPRRGAAALTDEGIKLLVARSLLVRSGESLRPAANATPLLTYYATSIAHHFDADAAKPKGNAASAG